MNFKEWFVKEMVGTGVVFDPKVKRVDFNVWGSPGSSGTTIKGQGPIKHWVKKKKS